MTHNIALVGKLRSGKDSVGQRLVDHHGYMRFAFGDELKRYAHELFDVPDGAKPRELYQWFGQMMRQRDPDIWVRKLFGKISTCIALFDRWVIDHAAARIVITDCRQPNEISALKSAGYVIIRVTCLDESRLERANAAGDRFTLADLTHDTESHVDGFDVDYTIDNDGTLDDLRERVDAVLRQINGGERT